MKGGASGHSGSTSNVLGSYGASIQFRPQPALAYSSRLIYEAEQLRLLALVRVVVYVISFGNCGLNSIWSQSREYLRPYRFIG